VIVGMGTIFEWTVGEEAGFSAAEDCSGKKTSALYLFDQFYASHLSGLSEACRRVYLSRRCSPGRGLACLSMRVPFSVFGAPHL